MREKAVPSWSDSNKQYVPWFLTEFRDQSKASGIVTLSECQEMCPELINYQGFIRHYGFVRT